MVERRVNQRIGLRAYDDGDGARMLIRPPRVYSTYPTSIVNMTENDLLALLDAAAGALEDLRLRRIA
jgi:hypothetical protein